MYITFSEDDIPIEECTFVESYTEPQIKTLTKIYRTTSGKIVKLNITSKIAHQQIVFGDYYDAIYYLISLGKIVQSGESPFNFSNIQKRVIIPFLEELKLKEPECFL
jgi:hypothetical protein